MATTTVSILRVIDDVGPTTGDIPPGGTTDDSRPTAEIALGNGAQVGDYVQLFMDGGTLPGAPVALTSTDIANGYVAITSSQPMWDGSHALTARYLDQAGNYGPTSDAVYIFNENGDGTGQTTTLTDGGYVITWHPSSSPDLYAQKYNSAGTPVGPQFFYHSGFGVGPANPVALSNAGYAITFDEATGSHTAGSGTNLFVFNGNGQQVSGSHLGGINGLELTATQGGFIVVGTSGYYYLDPGAYPGRFFLYDNSGTFLGGGMIASNSSPTLSVLSNGNFQVSWQDAVQNDAVRTLIADPNNPSNLLPPPAPSLTAFDDVAPVTGAITGPTNDTTPTIRVPVHESGAVEIATTWYQFTPEEISQGYKEITLSLNSGEYYYYSQVRIEGANGIIGNSTRLSLAIDTVAPSQVGAITKVLDDVGPVTGEVPPNGTTDDPTPTVQIAVGSWIKSGESIQLIINDAPVGAPVLVTSTDLANGYVSITPSPLADGHYLISNMTVDAAGNQGPAISDDAAWAISVQSDSTSRTLPANDSPGQHLNGGSGDDTFYAGHNSVVMTGDGGADKFVFQYLPWNAGHITDFAVGTDRIDMSALFQASGYTGSDPVGDGYLQFQSDGSDGTRVLYDTDGPATASPWLFVITDLDHVSPDGLTAASVFDPGGSPPPPPPPSGQTFTADDSPGQVLTGGSGDDIFYAGHNSVVMTGDGGADKFVFQYLPWNAGHITDFTPGTDKLDLHALFAASGYAGTDPIADGYLQFQSDGQGGTQVRFDPDGPGSGSPWQFLITTLDHVDPSNLHSGDWFM